MQIILSPMRQDEALTLHRAGEVLTINGEAFDFSPLPDGATLPRAAVGCPWLAADVERAGGVLRLTLILPHGADAPPETLFPEVITDPADGPVALPPHSLTPDTTLPETTSEDTPDAD